MTSKTPAERVEIAQNDVEYWTKRVANNPTKNNRIQLQKAKQLLDHWRFKLSNDDKESTNSN